MKFIKSVSEHIKQRRTDGANAFWCLWGDILQDDNGIYYYQEYARENPRITTVNELPYKVKKYVLSIL